MHEKDESYVGQLRKLVGNQKVITTAARAVIRDNNGRVLLIRRRDNFLWAMPAGGQELDESITDCLRREVKEECGLGVISATPMAIYSHISVVTTHGDPYHLFLMQFLVDEWVGTLITETDETVDARFFSIDCLPNQMPDHYQEALDDLRRYDGNLIVK